MKKIVERLPYSLKIKWSETVDSIMQREMRDVNLEKIAEFETRARVTNHQIFAKLSNDAKVQTLQATKGIFTITPGTTRLEENKHHLYVVHPAMQTTGFPNVTNSRKSTMKRDTNLSR
jgi:hypothetical protein